MNLWLAVLSPVASCHFDSEYQSALGATLAWLQIPKAIVSAENFPATSVTKGRRGMAPALMVCTTPTVHIGLDIVTGYALMTGKIAIYVRTIKRAGPSMLEVAHELHGTPLHKRGSTMRAANVIALHRIHEQTTLRKTPKFVICYRGLHSRDQQMVSCAQLQ